VLRSPWGRNHSPVCQRLWSCPTPEVLSPTQTRRLPPPLAPCLRHSMRCVCGSWAAEACVPEAVGKLPAHQCHGVHVSLAISHVDCSWS
jgi:hypothetical protein